MNYYEYHSRDDEAMVMNDDSGSVMSFGDLKDESQEWPLFITLFSEDDVIETTLKDAIESEDDDLIALCREEILSQIMKCVFVHEENGEWVEDE